MGELCGCVPTGRCQPGLHAEVGSMLLFPSPPQVTHLCWVPGEPYVIQTSEDKTVK